MTSNRTAGFSLIEVIAVLVVAGLMTGLAAVSLRGVTRAERLDEAVDRLRLLDERVRMIAEREHQVWRIDLSEGGATARPADAGEEDEAGVLEVRLGQRSASALGSPGTNSATRRSACGWTPRARVRTTAGPSAARTTAPRR